MIVWIALAVFLTIVLYWVFRVNRRASGRTGYPSVVFMLLAAVALVLAVWVMYGDRPDYVYQENDSPIAVSVVFDLSPSMLAIPDPSSSPGEKSRFERAMVVLKELFRTLEENQESVIVSMIGFTKNAEVIMGWESNIPQIREILEFVISPELFTNTGTSLESAVQTLDQVFDRLPSRYKENSRKIAVLVSDGEDTMPYSYMDYVEDQLRAGKFELIALHTGFLDINEGVPRYGEFGEFQGFQMMGGRIYTVPDAEVMKRLVTAAPGGVYVHAESRTAVETIASYIGSERPGSGGVDERLGLVLALFLVISAMCARLVL